MKKQARKRRAYGWTAKEIEKLETLWPGEKSNTELAAEFGFASVFTFQKSVRTLRLSKRANLPRRGRGKKPGPVTLAARARGCSSSVMERRLLRVLNEQGTVLIDNLLDDDVTTEPARVVA